MARSSGLVAGLTAAALAGVGFLAYKAEASVSDMKARPGANTSPGKTAPKTPVNPLALPTGSGSGERVVYGLQSRRVWLVENKTNKVKHTFQVMPSTVNPKPGTYSVTSRAGKIPGSDGVAIEHVVRFAKADGVTIGFSAAVNGSMAAPNPKKKTGGVRMTRADGDVIWSFATVGTKVVVIP
ncbi:hypothetical protein AB0G74_22565 [Streptomyces sp. NPDC020875]|uniref:hypothetical protein n=1 Tax=Streptomyces sp. NPDC020875 TaxID=3154898 RepID=UPI003400C834